VTYSKQDVDVSRKDAKTQSFVFSFLGGLARILESSAICVTVVFRIKKTVSKNLDRIT